jgi:glycerophosphoryl diester phosphodiesterase
MTKIIGHRGAAGLALENTRASLLAAIKHGVDMIELDTRKTADDHLVVIHDPHTGRMAADHAIINEKTLAELQAFDLNNGEQFLSLDDALGIIGSVPVIIELKESGSVDELLLALARHPKAVASVASFQHGELQKIRAALPDMPTYVLEHFSPLEIVHSAHHIDATGIGLNKWLMNPLTYRLAKQYKLELYVYTVNNPFIARFLRLFYPDIHLCTNHPERFIKPKRRGRPTTKHSASR